MRPSILPQGVKFDLQLPPKCKLIAQPPADLAEGDAAMLHYTWGSIWKDDGGKEIWSFDKRFYTDAKLELEVIHISATLVISLSANRIKTKYLLSSVLRSL